MARAATYTLHHRADSPTGLTPLTDFEVLRRFTADGDYRPLPTAPTLRRGWIARGLSEDDVVAALETLYPATIAAWAAERDGRLEPVSWGAVARRQTGQQGLVKRLAPELARDAVACHCAPERCLRRIVWDLAEDEPLGLPRGDGPVPCYEPCSLLVAFLRGVVGWQRGEGAGGGPVWAEFLARQGITEPVAQAAEDDDE